MATVMVHAEVPTAAAYPDSGRTARLASSFAIASQVKQTVGNIAYVAFLMEIKLGIYIRVKTYVLRQNFCPPLGGPNV